MLMRVLALLTVVALLVAAGWALNDAIQGAPRTAVNPIVLVEPSPDEPAEDDSGPRGQNKPSGHNPSGGGGRPDPNPNGGSTGGSGDGGPSGGAGGAAPAPPPPARPAGDEDEGGTGGEATGGGATDDGGGDD
jgi:hypothetical protein